MAHKVIENNREIYIIYEDIITLDDFNDDKVLECLDSNKNVTIELKNVTDVESSDGLAGLFFIGKYLPNVTFKGFSDDYKKSIDYRENL